MECGALQIEVIVDVDKARKSVLLTYSRCAAWQTRKQRITRQSKDTRAYRLCIHNMNRHLRTLSLIGWLKAAYVLAGALQSAPVAAAAESPFVNVPVPTMVHTQACISCMCTTVL